MTMKKKAEDALRGACSSVMNKALADAFKGMSDDDMNANMEKGTEVRIIAIVLPKCAGGVDMPGGRIEVTKILDSAVVH